MAFHLGYIADSDEEGQPTPKKRHRDEDTQAKDGKLESSTKGPPKRRQTLLAFAGKLPRCVIPEPESPQAPVQEPVQETVQEAQEAETPEPPSERYVGYALRDLRRVVTASLRRYGHLLHPEELQALRAFENLSLPAQQLYARLLSRKWPQWVSCQGLGARYRELGEAAAKVAAAELADPTGPSTEEAKLSSEAQEGEWRPLLDELKAADVAETTPWLLDSGKETAASLLQRPLSQRNCQEDNYGKLLLSALPVAELRRMGRGLGLADKGDKGGKGKGRLVENVCAAAAKQRLLPSKTEKPEAVEALVSQALRLGRWLCCADTCGRRALVLLGELFRMESCGAAEVSFVLFTTKWPEFTFQEAQPLFSDRESLDAFLAARSMAVEDFQRYTLESAEDDASVAEEGLRQAAAVANDFEAAKLRDPFRRRFTAAWCYAEALHHAVTNSPAVGHDAQLQAAKIRRLELLLSSQLCSSSRGRWYAELAKEVSRTQGPGAALELAAEGLAEGMDLASASATVDLTGDVASSQEVNAETIPETRAPLPRDFRWDLARRCRTLAKAAAKAKAKNAWKVRIQKTQAAQKDGHGKWLSDLVVRLIEEEDNATGPVRNVTATKLGLPQVAPADSTGTGAGRRRMFDGFRLEELTVEELAMQHYLGEGGNFQCGIHCEGAVLRDLFGLLLFDQMFHCSVEGAFVSAFQDAPLDLGTEAFYPSRSTAIEKRLGELTGMTPGDLAEEVRRSFHRLRGWRIRGVRWDRYDEAGMFLQSSKDTSPEKGADSESSAEDGSKTGNGRRVLWTNGADEVASEDRQLAAAAGAIGGRALAAALRLLCEDYNSAGLPDLLLWSWNGGSAARARFVEVKSERDTLARRQRLWLSTLRGAGAEAEVCHVRDGPVEDVFQSKLNRRRKRAPSAGSSEGF